MRARVVGERPGRDAAAEAKRLARETGVVPPFAQIFRSYSSFVWRVLLRLGVPEADVEDVAQEVFLSVHRTLTTYEGRCTLRSWIYGICHRRAIDYRRKAKLRRDMYGPNPPEQMEEAPQEQAVIASLVRERMRRVLDRLDDNKRIVFVLFDIEGIPMEEVATIVGCPLQTAYSRLYAARRKLEAALANVGDDPDMRFQVQLPASW